MARHFHRTLPGRLADATLGDLRGQYALALVGTLLVAVALGWVVAGRVLRPLAEITATARRVSQDRLDERIALEGPDDELRELADTFDDDARPPGRRRSPPRSASSPTRRTSCARR